MSEAEDWGDNFYTCMVCEKHFRSPLYEISRGYERTIFFDGDQIPVVEPAGSEGIGTYCSAACLNQDRDKLLLKENVRATFPGIGPIEVCSRCGKPVDMVQFHLSWTEEELNCQWGPFIDVLQPINVQSLAVVCQQCAPLNAAAIQEERSSSNLVDVVA